MQGSVGQITGQQFYSNHNNNVNNQHSPAALHGVHLSSHLLGYHGDSRTSLDRLEAEGTPATVDVADLLRQGYEVSSTSR